MKTKLSINEICNSIFSLLDTLCSEDSLKTSSLEEVQRILSVIQDRIEVQKQIADHLNQIKTLKDKTATGRSDKGKKVKKERSKKRKKEQNEDEWIDDSFPSFSNKVVEELLVEGQKKRREKTVEHTSI